MGGGQGQQLFAGNTDQGRHQLKKASTGAAETSSPSHKSQPHSLGARLGCSGEPRIVHSKASCDGLWPLSALSEAGWAQARRGDPLSSALALAAPTAPVLTQSQVFHTRSNQSPSTMASQPLPSACDIPEALIQACCPQHIHNLFKRRLPPLGTAVRAVFLACLLMCVRLFTQSCAPGVPAAAPLGILCQRGAPGLCKCAAKLPLESCPRGEHNLSLICSQILTSEV